MSELVGDRIFMIVMATPVAIGVSLWGIAMIVSAFKETKKDKSHKGESNGEK